MKSLAKDMSTYQRYHAKKMAKTTHFIGVPLLVFSILIALGWIHIEIPNLFHTRLSWLALIVASVHYMRQNIIIGSPLTVVLMMITIVANIISGGGMTLSSFYWVMITFMLGWTVLFVGHFLEKEKPNLKKEILQLINAPMFITAEIFFMLGLKRDLQDEVMLASRESGQTTDPVE